MTEAKIGTFDLRPKRAWELRYGRWHGNDPKYDIRQWEYLEDGTEVPLTGICLTRNQIEDLYALLRKEAGEEEK